MNNEHYPQDLAISLQDFETSGWKEAISQAACKGYSEMSLALSAAAQTAMEQKQIKHGKVLWLLADACSMKLSPSSPNEPFKPFFAIHDRHAVIPDDLSEADIVFFTEIVDTLEDNRLKARLSDLLWLKNNPRNTAFALKAIDAYCQVPLDKDTWIHDGRECWQRAIHLARMLKSVAGDRLQRIEESIVVAFNTTKRDEGFFGLWFAELLKSNNLGRTHRADIASKLEALAREFDSAGDIDKARGYFSTAAEYYKALHDAAKAAEMTVAVAESWVKDATVRITSETPLYAVAASFYENAIHTYRTIPKANRAIYSVDERIEELRIHLNNSGEHALEEMGVIKTPGVDITQLVENSRTSVIGKSAQDALFTFVNLYPAANTEKLRENVLDRVRQYPIQTLFAATVMSRDGRVIAKRPAMSWGTELTADDEIVIRAEMVRDYGIHVRLAVQGYIWPALEVLLLEHRLQELDFIDLARNSPFVPKNRIRLFGKALFAGYERDFITALHLLIPQIENSVREHLKWAGATTTNIDKNGIQNENGLSTLLELPETIQVFGKDLAFELYSLFCDSFGPNLRNGLAHGLLDEGDCNSIFSIYAWWLILGFTVNAWHAGKGH